MVIYAYLRLSTDRQDLHNQRQGIIEYANMHALSPIEFVEDTVCGEKWEQRGIGQLLTQTARAEDVVIFSEVSRIARSTLQVLEMLECCVRRGINVHIAKIGMVLDGSMRSRITATVLGLVAEIERELIVHRTTETLAKRKTEGKIVGRPKGRLAHLKLDAKESEIRKYLDKGISKRKRDEAQLVKSETMLRTIVQSEPQCVKLIAADGTLLDMNPAGLAMIEADSLEQLQGKPVSLIVVKKYRVALQALMKRIFQGESGVLEFEIVGFKGTHRWLEMHAVPLRDENQAITALLAVTLDVTIRKQTEELLASYNQTLERQVAERTQELEREKAALKHSESTNRAMISAIPDLLIQMSQDGTYLKVARSGNFLPFNPTQLKVGANVRDVLPPNIAQMQMEYTQQAIQTGELQVYEQKIASEDEVFNQEVRIVATGNNEVLVIIRDISEQRNAALRERKQALEASILEERNRMAREIHDTLAQAFTSIIVHLDAAAQRITLAPDSAQSHIKTGRALARSGLADARRSVQALRPQILEEGDLYSALARLASSMFSPTPVQVVCKAIGEPYILSKEVEINLLRIGQEALTNASKYANASEIRIELRYELSQCILQIKDNGQGFESTGSSIGRGFGLLGMSERAERIGASLAIRSQLGQGTEIVVGVKMP